MPIDDQSNWTAAKAFWQWLTSNAGGQAALAGAAGGFVRALTLRENFKEGFASLFVGALCAMYAAPLTLGVIGPALHALIKPDALDGFCAFATGIGGMAVVGLVLDFWKSYREQRSKGGPTA